jgi:hypothetical protein
MYKHIVEYRHKTKEGNISPMKSLEFELDRELYYDGPGEWKIICANMIVNKTGVNSSWIYLDDGTLKMKCLGRVKNNEEIKTQNTQGSYQSNLDRITENREKREAKLEEIRLKAEIEEREAKALSEKLAKQKAERKQKANELRNQGKNFQAFLVEFQNGVILGVMLLSFIIFLIVFSFNTSSKTNNAKAIHLELELIEDSIKLYIQNKDFDKALILSNKLNHPLKANMEHLEFDSWSGYPKYDEYWAKKKEEYKRIILNKGIVINEMIDVNKKEIINEIKKPQSNEDNYDEDKYDDENIDEDNYDDENIDDENGNFNN